VLQNQAGVVSVAHQPSERLSKEGDVAASDKTETERNKKNNVYTNHLSPDCGRALPQLVKATKTGLELMVNVSVYLFCSAQLSTFGL